MKLKEIRGKSDQELRDEAARLRREGYHLKVQAATSQLENPSRVRAARRTVARILTILGERDRAGSGKKEKGKE